MTSGKNILILYAKQPMENHRGSTPKEKSHGVKRINTWLFLINRINKAETFLNPEPYPESGRLDYGGEVARNPAIFHYRGGRPLQQIWGKK